MNKLWNIFKNFRRFPVSSVREQGTKRRLCRLEHLEDRSLLSAVGIIPGTSVENATWENYENAIVQPLNTYDQIPSVGILTDSSGNASFTVEEGDDFQVSLTRSNTEGNLTVYYIISPNTNSCFAGLDFDSTASYETPGSVTFEDGSSTATISIEIIDDAYIENPESFSLSLIYYPSYYNCNYTIDYNLTTTVYCTIEDNDSWTVSVTQTGNSIYEMYGTASNGNNYSADNPKFTISHTGITDPNDENAPELRVFFTLSGTASSDDYDLCRDGGSWSKYYDQPNTFSFNGEQSFDLYINPYNQYCDPEEDETIILTLITNPYSWGDAGSEYTISGPASQTIAILDDDHFDIILEAVDSIATERMDGVDPDNGLFKISRVASNGRTVLDTSYAINLNFETNEVREGEFLPGTTSYGATDFIDYNFGATALNENDATNYITGFSPYNSEDVYDTNGNYLYRIRRYSGMLQANTDEVFLRVDPNFDWLDEGERYYGSVLSEAFTQTGEAVSLRLKSASWGYNQTRTWNSSDIGKVACVEIRDGAICKLLADLNNDDIISAIDDPATDDPNSLGTIIRKNNDDDNNDQISDWSLYSYTRQNSNSDAFNSNGGITIEGENDLEQVRLLAGVESLAGSDYEIDVYFTTMDSYIQLWTRADKGELLLEGDLYSGRINENRVLAQLSGSNTTFSRDLYVESISDRYDILSLYCSVYDSNDYYKDGDVETARFFPVTLNPYTPDTTYIAPMILPESTWKTSGVGIRRNLDDFDSDNNLIETDENDLIRLDVGFDGNLNYTYELTRSSSNLKLWYDDQQTNGYSFNNNNETTIWLSSPGTVWVEYASAGNTTETLTFRVKTNDTTLYEETVEFKPFNGITMAFVGEFQQAGNVTHSPGINTWVIQELRAGYDVHVWDDGYDVCILEENNPFWTESGLYNNYAIDCYTDGTGRAFDELCAAINYRGQTKVSLIGYSHGGGSVYNLSRRLAYDGRYNSELNQTFTNRLTQNYQLVFTSYIDGITNTYSLSVDSETRFPINSEYHLNQYQRSSYYDTISNFTLCWGNEIIGADNLDRTFLGVVHSTIDENPAVLEQLSYRFHAHGVR